MLACNQFGKSTYRVRWSEFVEQLFWRRFLMSTRLGMIDEGDDGEFFDRCQKNFAICQAIVGIVVVHSST